MAGPQPIYVGEPLDIEAVVAVAVHDQPVALGDRGRAALVAEIEEAAEDPDVVMWFGPDEVDLWNDWSTAAGIRRGLPALPLPGRSRVGAPSHRTWNPGRTPQF